ncbi:MAG TPA: methyltransferase domain-containing protein [Polyangiaceae bacterium]|nr:methyltransferase domain-containing protein [Polyangiaceae bacterium]
MNGSASEQAIAAATAYEDFFVPAMFREWAPRVADAARIEAGARVLDVACGTGVVAREAARRVGPEGKVVGLDANPGMLAVAARLAPSLAWQQGDAHELPFESGSFDVVVSQFGLMFFADRVRALREMLRVVAPGGRIAVCVWDALENAPAYALEVELLEQYAGKAAADALRAPFVLGDRQEVERLFELAGAASITAKTVAGTGRFPSARAMLEADLRGWLPLVGIVIAEPQIEALLARAEEAFHPYVDAHGVLLCPAPAHIVSGTRH